MAGNTILFVIMGICGVFMALPLVMILNNALKPLDELFRYPPQIFVRNPSLDNFSDLYVLMSSSWVAVYPVCVKHTDHYRARNRRACAVCILSSLSACKT